MTVNRIPDASRSTKSGCQARSTLFTVSYLRHSHSARRGTLQPIATHHLWKSLLSFQCFISKFAPLTLVGISRCTARIGHVCIAETLFIIIPLSRGFIACPIYQENCRPVCPWMEASIQTNAPSKKKKKTLEMIQQKVRNNV